MNFIKKIFSKFSQRHIKTIITRGYSTKESLIAEQLTERSLIRVEGKETIPYLQGLITNDMNHFHRGAQCIYTMFLNNTGRVLYDSIIYRAQDEDVYFIECDKTICRELKRHLRLYRVRRKIEVDSIETEFSSWVIFKNENHSCEDDFTKDDKNNVTSELDIKEIQLPKSYEDFKAEDVLLTNDPRMKSLGCRLIMPHSFSYPELNKLFTNYNIQPPNDNLNYKYLRYSLGVGEGIQDHPVNKCFALEANCDFLHGVSFQKGCYVGQELTARVHHTGVIRKRLMPIKLIKPLTSSIGEGGGGGVINIQTIGGTVVGVLRGSKNDVGLGLLRVEQVLKTPNLIIDDIPCKTFVPNWWPREMTLKTAVKQERIIETT